MATPEEERAKQADLDRLMAQATSTAPPQTTPDATLQAMAQDTVTANQPLPTPTGTPPVAPGGDAVDAALAAGQPPAAPAPGTPATPGSAPAAEPAIQPPAVPPTPAAPPAPPVAPATNPVDEFNGKVSFAQAGKQLVRAERASGEEAKAQEALGNAEANTSEVKAQGHEAQKDELIRQVSEADAFAKAREEGMAKARALADQAESQYKNYSFHDYFGTHRDEAGNEVANPGGSKTLARVFSFLGGFAAGPDHPNQAIQNIEHGIAMDMQRQKDELAKRETWAKWKREGVKDLASEYTSQLALMQVKHGALLKATAEQAEAEAARSGSEEAKAKAAMLAQGLRVKGAQFTATGVEKLANAQAQLALTREKLNQSTPDSPTVQTAIAAFAAKHASEPDKVVAFAASVGSKNPQAAAILASKTPEKIEGDEAKAAAAKDAATVTLKDGSDLKLPTARAVPQFVAGYTSRTQAADKLKALLTHLESEGNVYLPDAVAERERLLKDANIAVGSISSMGQSDHSTHLEAGTLGPTAVRPIPGLQAGKEVAIKAVKEKLQQVEDGTNQIIQTYRHEGAKGAKSGDGAKPVKAPAPGGVHMKLKDGRTGYVYPGGKFDPDDDSGDITL